MFVPEIHMIQLTCLRNEELIKKTLKKEKKQRYFYLRILMKQNGNPVLLLKKQIFESRYKQMKYNLVDDK